MFKILFVHSETQGKNLFAFIYISAGSSYLYDVGVLSSSLFVCFLLYHQPKHMKEFRP